MTTRLTAHGTCVGQPTGGRDATRTLGLVTPAPAQPLEAEGLRSRVDKALDDALAQQAAVLDEVSDDLAPVMAALSDLLRGGKRLRPAFCYWGWRGAGGADRPEIVTVAAALELFQAAALVHDDVMDASDTRRGHPSVHRRVAALHRRSGWLGSSESFGVAGAILSGDLCLSWCDEMYAGSGLPADVLLRGRVVFDRMRTELMCGQYLDMLESVQERTTVERARRVILYKSAKYSVVQPLLLGGTLAGAGPTLLAAYDRFGRALGEAFQLRDDVLGVFGDPAVTGKPAGDDLREGKRTVLVAMTLDRCSPGEAAELRAGLGDPDLDTAGVEALRDLMRRSGALDEVEKLISAQSQAALDALPAVPEPARDVLAELVVAATSRTG
jgi:geranylgeranyl diphosphate synthase type I